ncbi:MAG TPA: cytochrome c oxidase subunit II [Stellaceae bacterium]|jgi:cytochrome c oxidase subunit 2|nr:cytochrome c oxidase subunit II [Stellaceae bacterium]
MNGIPFLPPSASSIAGEFNVLFGALLAVTGLVLFLVVWLMFRFCVHYRKSNADADRNHRIKKSWHWEVGWTTASLVIFVGLYAWGAEFYLREHRAPADATDIYVVGKQWMWKIEHPDGQREINALHLALDRPVRLVMTSEDVIHGFSVPAFRLKQDVVPGRYVTLWFTPIEAGNYHLYCTQFCGTDHAAMGGSVTVLDTGDFQKWLAANAITGAGTLAAQGGALYRRLGCSGCHDTEPRIGPPLAGLYLHRVTLRDGGDALADDGFIREAILDPATHPPAGYKTVMPSFAGQVDEEQVVALVAYIKSLAGKAAP